MTLFKKIYIHPLTIVLAIIVTLTGMYKDFLIIFLIIIIHELGHLFMSIIYKWNIDKIYIYPSEWGLSPNTAIRGFRMVKSFFRQASSNFSL